MNFDEFQDSNYELNWSNRDKQGHKGSYPNNTEKVNKLYIWILVFFSSIGGFLFGCDTSVIAGANLYINNDFPEITTFQKELVVSMTMLGAAIGSIIGGPTSDKYGRKPTIFIADVMFTLGSIFMAFTPNITLLIFGRFIVGLGVGTAAMVVPIYLAEVAPKRIRGIIVSLNNVFITAGQFISLIIWLLLGENWRWMLGLAGIPSLLQAIGILYLCESPRFLYKNYQSGKAVAALKQIYNEDLKGLENVINEQMLEAGRVRKYENEGYFNMLRQLFTKYRPWLIAGCGLQMFQQLCGITIVVFELVLLCTVFFCLYFKND